MTGEQHHGSADLIFTDGQGLYALVEVKCIDIEKHGSKARVKCSKRRKKVYQQAIKYSEAFAQMNKHGLVLAATYTADNGLEWLHPDGVNHNTTVSMLAKAARESVDLLRPQSSRALRLAEQSQAAAVTSTSAPVKSQPSDSALPEIEFEQPGQLEVNMTAWVSCLLLCFATLVIDRFRRL